MASDKDIMAKGLMVQFRENMAVLVKKIDKATSLSEVAELYYKCGDLCVDVNHRLDELEKQDNE